MQGHVDSHIIVNIIIGTVIKNRNMGKIMERTGFFLL